MLKYTLVAGIISLGFIVSTPAMARGGHDFQRIYPVHNNHNHHQPVRHCVSGKQINKRQKQQRRRIQQGVRSGALVKWEEQQLNKQQRNIRKTENRMRRSDHCLTRNEFNQLMNRLDRASNKIRKLKSNNKRRHRHNH